MVKASPCSAFKVVKANLLLEFLVVPLDAPPQLGESNQLAVRHGRRQRRQVVLGRRLGLARPLAE
jgi:hypothetical protein